MSPALLTGAQRPQDVPGCCPRMLETGPSGLWAIRCLWPGSKAPFMVAEGGPASQVVHSPAEL